MFNSNCTVMRKFLYTLILSILALIVIPSCTNTDSLDEVIQKSELDISAASEDKEKKSNKPVSKK